MKKLLSFLLAVVLCFGMVACGVKPPPATPPVQDPPQDDPPATVYDVAMKSIGVVIGRDAAARKYSLTTGFVLTEDGKILTNYSAIEHCASAEVSIDGKTYAITSVLAWDEALDLVVLQCDGTGLPVLPFSGALPAQGETVYAFGNLVGGAPVFGQGAVTEVSEKHVYHNALSENHSGGILLNAQGQVMGVHAGHQEQGKPYAIPIVPLLQSLSYGEPQTLQEVYTLDHASAVYRLQTWLEEKGTEADGWITYQYPSDTETYSVSYCAEENLLRVEYAYLYESGDTYVFHLERPCDEEQWRYWSDYHFAEGEEVYADGTINAMEFTSQSALSMENLTMENQRNQLGALNTAAVKKLLSWLHGALSYSQNENADLGFLWHGKA